MSKFTFTSPDGQSYDVEGPAGATQEQAFSMLQQKIGGGQPQQQPSTLQRVHQFTEPVAEGLGSVAGGLLAVPPAALGAPETLGASALLVPIGMGLGAGIGRSAENAVMGYLGLPDNRSGGQRVMDIAETVVMNAVAPGATEAVLRGAGKVAGRAASYLVGDLGTRAGSVPIAKAYEAGKIGGKEAATFQGNLRGDVPQSDVLAQTKDALGSMKAAKNAEYRQGMAGVSGDKTVLDFSGIDKEVKQGSDIVSYKGVIKNDAAAKVQQKIANAVQGWKSLDPAEYHTPEGFDALKQKIGGIVESIPFEEKTARLVGNKVYNSIRSEIIKQAPTYAGVMKDYETASTLVKEIETSLSQGRKSSADTALRKLQSVMRNSSSNGNRMEMVKRLEQSGAPNLTAALAGQALNPTAPAGFGGRSIASGTAMAGAYLHSPWAIPLLAAQSPRLMGEAAYYAGKSSNALNKLPAAVVGRTIPPMVDRAKQKNALNNQPKD